MKPGAGPEYVTIGQVLGGFGAEGLVKVRPLTDFPERFPELETVRFEASGPLGKSPEVRRVVSCVPHGGGLFVLGFEGVTTREHAASLVGLWLQIPVAEVRPLPAGQFYRFEVVGLEVRDEAGQVLGRVKDILETGANDVYVVAAGEGTRTKDEILFPALKQVVLKIDPRAGVMVVRPPRQWDEP
jgi:16S rRNA processing protein RimM